MSNKKFRILAGIVLMVMMFALYLILANNDGDNQPDKPSSDGVVLK